MDKIVDLSLKDKMYKYQLVAENEGLFGSVLKVKNNEDNKFYAMKILNLKDTMANPDNFGNEMINIIKDINTFNLNHPNITKFHESYFTFDDKFVIVTEQSESNLKTFRENNDSLSNDKIADIMIQIMKAIIHLNNRNIMHRRLSPQNIQVFENGSKFKICDFGFSQLDTKQSTYTQDPYFTAPEVESSDVFNQSQQVDVWSAGIILYYLCTGNNRYEELAIPQLKKQDENKVISLNGDKNVFEQLLNKMLKLNPQQRLDAYSVLSELCNLKSESVLKHLKHVELKGERNINKNDGRCPFNMKIKEINSFIPFILTLIESSCLQLNQMMVIIIRGNSIKKLNKEMEQVDFIVKNYFIGEWRDDKINGFGKYAWNNGDYYEGQFLNEALNGLGFYNYASGNKFYGQWMNNQRSGLGVYTFKDGDIELGQFCNNFEHGIQMLLSKNGSEIQIRKYQMGKLKKNMLNVDNSTKCNTF
ncbi:camk family protein kinase [Stylonychia lemnae]|uniref:Camk family protein kinase n=1 Tax=Stylonychia lemnae TaxID=5949 RepID=A0A077ZML3_STYLE|nr:camk family protein kinase [Stylonychia lemnae]|eukprot:CDW71207.1 camk family protein kinase [Stylonychia lemnae]